MLGGDESKLRANFRPMAENNVKAQLLLAQVIIEEKIEVSDADLDALHLSADAPERKAIHLLNPISSNLTTMRSALAPSMLRTVVENLKRGNQNGRVFELGNIYVPKQLPVTELPEEILHMGFAAFGAEEDFFTLKGAVEAIAEAFGLCFQFERADGVSYLHPGISAYILCGDKRIGAFGRLSNEITHELDLPKDSKENYNIFLGEIDYRLLSEQIPDVVRYQPISDFPTVTRDLSLLVEERMTCGELTDEIRSACKQVGSVELFDIYRGKQIGEGKKSMSFNISFVPGDKALEPKDVDRFIHKILGQLEHKLHVTIR